MSAFRYILLLVTAAMLLAPACGDPESRPRAAVTPTLASPSQSPGPLPVDSPPAPATPSPIPPAAPKAAKPASPAGPIFHSNIAAIDDATRARMTHSWREGCPVSIQDLRLVTLDHWGFDSAVHKGELIVHRGHAEKIVSAMRKVFEGRFFIERMEFVDVYAADDDASMAANNTSAFNCREVEGKPGVWSQHAYGRAIDINPVQNPYVSGSGEVSPPAGSAYTNRTKSAPGMIHSGDLVVKGFSSIGWGWGGYWSSSKDYQHFSSTGR